MIFFHRKWTRPSKTAYLIPFKTVLLLQLANLVRICLFAYEEWRILRNYKDLVTFELDLKLMIDSLKVCRRICLGKASFLPDGRTPTMVIQLIIASRISSISLHRRKLGTSFDYRLLLSNSTTTMTDGRSAIDIECMSCEWSSCM